jgi:hypothetical protein
VVSHVAAGEHIVPGPFHILRTLMEIFDGTTSSVLIFFNFPSVKMFMNEEDENLEVETHNFHVPTKHEVISSLAVGGRWVTSQSDLQVITVEE